MESGIYKITNPEGKVYIGKSSNIDTRFERYSRYWTTNRQPKLFDSFDKYGFENHTFDKLDKNVELETYYITEYDSYKNGLNANKGGGGVVSHSEESRTKISIAGKLNKGKRVVSHRKGKTIPDEVKMKISKTKKGKPIPGNRKPVLQYSKEGEFIAEHISIEHAALAVKGNPTAISNTLKKGGGATSSSYIWVYKT